LNKYREVLRPDLRNEKKNILTEGLHQSDVEDQKFCPIEREYERRSGRGPRSFRERVSAR
jgi:hypothetical protein